MDHFVKLDSLPEGYVFPPEMKDRMHFDPVAHKLIFRGYMSKVEFDRLSKMSNDWKFRRVLEELFRQCVAEDEVRPSGVRKFLAAVARLFT